MKLNDGLGQSTVHLIVEISTDGRKERGVHFYDLLVNKRKLLILFKPSL